MIDTLYLFDQLMMDDNPDLITRLDKALQRVPGYETIVVPAEGFSDSDTLHNMVLEWCKENKIRTFNPGLEAARLQSACSWESRPAQPPPDFVELYHRSTK